MKGKGKMKTKRKQTRIAPCPICGEEPRLDNEESHRLGGPYVIGWDVWCCYVKVSADTEEDVVKRWNKLFKGKRK